MSVHLQYFQLERNNFSDSSLSTFTKETDGKETAEASLNPFLEAETNNFLKSNSNTFQEDRNIPLPAFSQPFQRENNNFSNTSSSTLTNETGGQEMGDQETDDQEMGAQETAETSLNPLLVAETNNYLTSNFNIFLKDTNIPLIAYSQSFQLESSNCSGSSLSNFTKETGGQEKVNQEKDDQEMGGQDTAETSLNPLLVPQTNNYFTPNFNTCQEDKSIPLFGNLHSFEEETEETLATNLHQIQVEFNNNLAVQLYSMFAKEEKRNILFSPFSISTFMALLICGDVEYDYSYDEPISVYSVVSQFNTLQFANAILIQNDSEFRQRYTEILGDFFKTLLLGVNFLSENEETVTRINEWMNNRTNGTIPMMLESLDPSTVLYNAAYFEATWIDQFDKRLTSLHNFYNCGAEGDTKLIYMMFKTAYFSFYEDEDLQVLELPCNEEKVSMLILLPRAKDGLECVEASLAPSFIQDLKIKLQKTSVHVGFPQFRVECTKIIAPCFQHYVCDVAPEVHSSIASRFSDVAASGILHKAVLKINEKGCNTEYNTEATSEMDCFLKFNPQFIADHPFAFVISDGKSDTILLMGRVYDP